ncbi:hypothetical protein E3N88_08432 [Mikania micrantha]|uniref:Uncharacterized protein n=1 Tax=Mikania micrantha TaxID=192012 RepID=A0A5N6PIG6_9ASTR|nr:hypothetical protein E3N88_08432 [Mikania micrantha]
MKWATGRPSNSEFNLYHGRRSQSSSPNIVAVIKGIIPINSPLGKYSVEILHHDEWFSINKKGENCEMISFAECLNSDTSNSWLSCYKSRFAVGSLRYKDGKLKTHVKSQFLSPLTTYTVNLVFKFRFRASKWQPIYLKYRLQGETRTLVSCLAYEREDGWLECELFQFTSDSQIVNLEILFDEFENFFDSVEVEGIEFRPLEKVEHKDENQSISDSDAYWEEKLPTDYEDIMKWSTDIMQWTTKKEAYSIIHKGFLIDDGEKVTLKHYICY